MDAATKQRAEDLARAGLTFGQVRKELGLRSVEDAVRAVWEGRTAGEKTLGRRRQPTPTPTPTEPDPPAIKSAPPDRPAIRLAAVRCHQQMTIF